MMDGYEPDWGSEYDGASVRTAAVVAGVEFVDLDLLGVRASVVQLIPESVSRRCSVLCVGCEVSSNAEVTLVVAMSSPLDRFPVDDVQVRSSCLVRRVAALR